MNIEDNKIISEFVEDYYIWDYKSWNKIMPVVEKIESMRYATSFKTGYCRINPIDTYSENDCIVWCNPNGYTMYRDGEVVPSEANNWCILREPTIAIACDGESIGKLSMIYICVVEFIKWYNKNRK